MAIEGHVGQVARCVLAARVDDGGHVLTEGRDGCQLRHQVDVGRHQRLDGRLVCDGQRRRARHLL